MSNIKITTITAIIWLLAFAPQAYAVGFHSAGGGGGGSSSSSSSGGGDLLPTIILLIIILIITSIRNKNRGRRETERKKQLQRLQSLHLKEDKNFSIDLIESRIQNNILDVLYGLTDGDEELVRTYCTDNFMNVMKLENNEKHEIDSINNYRRNNYSLEKAGLNDEKLRGVILEELKRYAKHICWVDIKLDSINSDETSDYINLKLYFKVIEQSGYVRNLNRIMVTLKRRDKVITEALNQNPKLKNCKCCGAPMNYNLTHTCEYCGNTSRLSEDDTWMIDDMYITLSDYPNMSFDDHITGC